GAVVERDLVAQRRGDRGRQDSVLAREVRERQKLLQGPLGRGPRLGQEILEGGDRLGGGDRDHRRGRRAPQGHDEGSRRRGAGGRGGGSVSGGWPYTMGVGVPTAFGCRARTGATSSGSGTTRACAMPCSEETYATTRPASIWMLSLGCTSAATVSIVNGRRTG